ncbi:hypothetical protein E8E95_10820 [Pseudomonas sp. BN414]|uniref:beta strand repeat-containing protein n=1 Tax=Pseudomonas sp. BN414 TaxID=2567888 RepID=UPI002456D7D4|nr:hypothetical protein [Pseudomonas sp. BN414]MDH4567173.1 hypothetical protein [Pseudomonas sp. BN414]
MTNTAGEKAMTITTTGSLTILDETAGLQNFTATPSEPEDSNDTEILLAALPSIFSNRLTALLAGTATSAALSGYTGAAGNTGSNAFTISAAPGASITDVSFVDSSGAALNGLDSGLDTLDGTSIFLYTDTSNNNILLGRAGGATGAIVFAAYIEETGSPVSGGKIWTVEYQPLKHPDTTNPDDALNLADKVFIGTSEDLVFSLANAPSGQNLFLMFTTATPTVVNGRITDPTIIATGKNPADQSAGANITTGDTINTSQAGGPTTFGTNNQMITEQEGIRFSFVTGARQNVTIPNLDQNEADLESNIDFTAVFNARAASFDVVQLQSGKTAQVKISAFTTATESGVDFINGYSNDTSVAITNVRVINISTGQVIENSNGSVNDPGIAITFTAGVATITGVKAGYKIEYTTTADHNRVLVENGAALNAKGTNHADFDIGGFKLTHVSTATAEIGSKLVFEDDGPSANGTAVAGTVDEDGLAGGIAGGTGDVAGAATVASGSVTGIFQSGADAPLTYSLSSDTSGLPALTSGGVAVTYSVVGNTLTASAGAVDVFTFSLTAAGAYSFTLLKPLDHAPGNDENDITLNLGSLLRATDADGDKVTAAAEKLVITVDDDTPTATGAAATGTVDEDGLAGGIAGGTGDVAGAATTASGSVTGIFQSGADAPLSYALSGDTSGLPQTLTSGGVAVTYSVVGNTLTASAGAVDVFTFSLTTAGAYSFTLLKALDHAAGNDENDITINLGSLLRATDADGDTVAASAEKLVITVDDDTPTATGAAASGTVDEDGLTGGIAGGTGDVAGAATTASGSVTGIFQSGADAPLSYALSGDTSGLPQTLTSGGVAVTYSVVGNTLTASAGAVDVFTFSLTTAGAYSFTLLKALDHAAGNDENDITLNLGSLLRATDADGDTVTAAAEKLVITVDDDTPTATGAAATGTVDEDGLAGGIAGGTGDVAGAATTASGSVTGIFQSGADAPLSYSLSGDTSGLPALTSGGVAVTYSVVGNTLTASAGAVDVFTFSLTAAGAYNFTLLKALDHAAGNDENDITLNLGSLLRATDADGDTVTAAPEKLVITVDDDTPTATGAAASGTVDEDGLAGGIAGGIGDVAGAATVASGSVTGIFQSGADAPLSYALSGDTSGLPQSLTSGGVAVTYSVVGNLLTASAGAVDVFTFSLTTAGAYSFTLLKPLDHAAGNDENDITLNLGSLLRATDADGDTVTAAAEKLVITVDDDTPTATGAAASGTVDEDGLAGGIAGGTGDVAGAATVASGSVTGIFQSGADAPLSYSLSGDTSGLPQTLTSGGVAVTYSVVGNTLTASAGAVDVFTFSLTAAGAYSFTLLKALDHAAGNDENDITLNLGSLLRATDADGDTVTAAPEKLVITVDDDTPTATGAAATGTVDEDGLAGGIAGGTGDVAGAATVASGSVTGIFQSGADAPLSYSLSSNTSGLPQTLTSGGVAVTYNVVGNLLTASAGAVAVFTFSLTAAGAYSFTLLKALDHAAGNDENDITLNLGSLLQATDADGDTVTAAPEKLVITVDDDTPTLAFGNLMGTGTILPQYGNWSMAAGADGLGAAGLDISLVNGQFTLVRPDNTTTTGSGTLTELSPSPDANGAYRFAGSLTGDFDNNATTANTTIDYTLTAFANGTYALDLVQGFSSTIVLSSADGSLDAGGPDPVRTLLIPKQDPPTIPSPSEEIVFFGVNAGTTAAQVLSAIVQGAPDLTEAQIEAGGFSFLGTADVNVSTSGIGVGNNNLDGNGTAGINSGDESFVINPETLLTAMKVFIDNTLQGYNPATEELYYRIFFEDGTSSAQTKVLAADLVSEAGNQKSFLVQWDGAKMIDAVQLTMGLGVIKVPVIQFIKQVESMANDIQLAFNATLTDKDGDTATSTLDANLFANDPNDPLFDYRMAGTIGEQDAFNVDLSAAENLYQVNGFDAGPSLRDKLVLIGDAGAVVQSIDNTGANSIVTIDESGAQNTTITVVGVDLLNTDIMFGSA